MSQSIDTFIVIDPLTYGTSAIYDNLGCTYSLLLPHSRIEIIPEPDLTFSKFSRHAHSRLLNLSLYTLIDPPLYAMAS